jgi:GAF domain-containing protein
LLIRENVDEWLRAHGIESIGQVALSWLGAPLLTGDKVTGLVAVQTTNAGQHFEEHDRELLSAIAGQMAIALENARLLEETQRRGREAQRRSDELAAVNEVAATVSRQLDELQLLETAYEQLSRVMSTDAFFVGIYDAQADRVRYPLTYDSGERYIGTAEWVPPRANIRRVIDSCQPIVLNLTREQVETQVVNPQLAVGDVQKISASLLYAPMQIGPRVIGVISVQSYQYNAYQQRDVSILVGVANHLAVALENSRLFGQIQARASELAILNEMGRAFAAKLDLDAILDSIHHYTARLMDTTNLYVALYDARRDEIDFALDIRGDDIRWHAGKRRSGHGLTEHVIRTREPLLLVDNVEARLDELGVERIGASAQSWLGAPMSVGDQTTGMIAVQSYTTPHLYDERSRDLLSAVAIQAAIAIENARLFKQLQARARREQLLREVTAKVRGASDVDTILRTAAREVGRAFNRPAFAYLGREAEAEVEIETRE